MAFVVIFLPRARFDIRRTGAWFGERSRAAEARGRSQMLKVVQKFSEAPKAYPQADEAKDVGRDLREMLVGRRRGIRHRVLFTIDCDTVYVHRVRHASQDRLTEDDL